LFFPGSRYEGVPVATHIDPRGEGIAYVLLRRTPSPQPDRVHTVHQGDRLDLLAWTFYGDPEQYWRICDANGAFDPHELVREPGHRLMIPLQER
jgi:nucleoid-associated protein YgaU